MRLLRRAWGWPILAVATLIPIVLRPIGGMGPCLAETSERLNGPDFTTTRSPIDKNINIGQL